MRSTPTTADSSSLAEIFFSSLKLGLIAFGGPTAHLGHFREEYVRKRRWLSDAEYGDLLALSQFLPGPGSSQTIFALGLRRGGWRGGALASVGFTLPAALLMTAFAYGITRMGDVTESGWLSGLKIAAVAVVAKAVVEMSRTLCATLLLQMIAVVACASLILLPHPLLQLGIIVLGAGIHGIARRPTSTAAKATAPPGSHRVALACLGLFVLLLITLPLLSALWHSSGLTLFDRFYRAGSAVFGGGHVVLPLLEAAVVPDGHVSSDAFIAGYGAAQAIPGPLFTFSAYLGTLSAHGSPAWTGGLVCLMALFLPGWLLMAGALPFWDRLRSVPTAKAALAGANAAVVGVLAAALWSPVITRSLHGLTEALLAVAGFLLLKWSKCPPWLWVLLAAGAGQALLG